MANCECCKYRIGCENYEPKSTTACERYADDERNVLKPCPFCGGEARTKVVIGQLDMIVTKVGCFDCEVWKYSKINSGDSIERFNEAVQKVVSKWNRRDKR